MIEGCSALLHKVLHTCQIALLSGSTKDFWLRVFECIRMALLSEAMFLIVLIC